MKRNLVDTPQTFGNVEQKRMMPAMGRPAEMNSKRLGSDTNVDNMGRTEVKSFLNPNPGAEAKACAHSDFAKPSNEFHWTDGKPKKGK